MLRNLMLDVKDTRDDLFEKPAGCNLKEWFNEIKKFVRKEPCWVKTDACLKLVSGRETLTIPACTGDRTLRGIKGTLNSCNGSVFGCYQPESNSTATNKISVEVYELTKSVTLARMFTSLSFNLDALSLTENQIVIFMEKYLNWLQFDVMTTLFLFKNGGNFFVANVYTSTVGSRIMIDLYPLDTCIRFEDYPRRRVVVAKIDA